MDNGTLRIFGLIVAMGLVFAVVARVGTNAWYADMEDHFRQVERGEVDAEQLLSDWQAQREAEQARQVEREALSARRAQRSVYVLIALLAVGTVAGHRVLAKMNAEAARSRADTPPPPTPEPPAP